MDRCILTLGIRHVGETTARLIARRCGSWPSFHAACVKLAAGDARERRKTTAFGQIGATVIDGLAEYFRERHNRGLVERLTAQVHIGRAERTTARGPIAGKTVVFTGTLERMTRERAKELAEPLGARAASSVSKSTDYVVAGPGAGVKLDKARAFGVPILSEAEWSRLLGAHQPVTNP